MQTSKISETGTSTPLKRGKLKGRVFESGYETLTVFAEEVGIHRVYLSQVLNGITFPSPALQRRLAEKLGLTLRELRELL